MSHSVSVRSLNGSSTEALERALLGRIAARDRSAMREFYLVYHRRLARFLRRLTLRQELIDEIINDTMLIVWRSAAAYRGESRVSTWIMGIAYRSGLKSLRLEQRFTANGEVAEVDGVDAQSAAAERVDLVTKALTALSLDHRLVIEFTYYAGYSCEEIAKIMECPSNTVKTRLFYARDKLRTLLPSLSGGAAL